MYPYMFREIQKESPLSRVLYSQHFISRWYTSPFVIDPCVTILIAFKLFCVIFLFVVYLNMHGILLGSLISLGVILGLALIVYLVWFIRRDSSRKVVELPRVIDEPLEEKPPLKYSHV